MRTYLICYDVPGQQRHALANAIMQLGEAWARPLECTWYVQSPERADAIGRRLQPLADAAEGLLIQEVVDARALLMNTALRWFRKRQAAPGGLSAEPVALAA